MSLFLLSFFAVKREFLEDMESETGQYFKNNICLRN
jgi:hypothetical protein